MLILPAPAMFPKPTGTFIANTNSTANASTYTFTAASIGTAAADRIVVVACGAYDDGAASPTITAPTIGGTAAIIAASTASSAIATAVFYLLVPSGTTANIVTGALGATCERCAISVYTITGWTAYAPFTTATVSSSSTAAVRAGCFGVGMVVNSATTAVTWVGLTEDTDYTWETTRRFSSANGSFAVSNATESVTATVGTGKMAFWR